MVQTNDRSRWLASKETEIGRAITLKWFKAVAEILAAIYRLRKGAA